MSLPIATPSSPVSVAPAACSFSRCSSVSWLSVGPSTPTTNPQEKPVQHYVLLFRATRPFTPEEQTHRIADIAAWVKQVSAMGVTLNPHTLGDTVAAYASKDNQPVAHAGAIDPTLANLVFFDSTEEQAAEIARLHPAPHYGV